MAGIDKTYTKSFKEYSDFKEWAKDKSVTFFDGHKRNIIDYVYTDIHESAFDGREVPIMNTPKWVDIYLIQNCPFEFVHKRMKEVYTEQSYKRISKVNLSALPPKHLQKHGITHS